MSKNDGGPAFPTHGSIGEVATYGMSLRDYFAAHALQGWLASFPADAKLDKSGMERLATQMGWISDAMLKERSK